MGIADEGEAHVSRRPLYSIRAVRHFG
jgi:hypothetical protein